jgi:hypothetical protein
VLPHRSGSIVCLRARVGGARVFFLFAFCFPSFPRERLWCTALESASRGGPRGRVGRMRMGRMSRPSGVTRHCGRRWTFSGVTRDMSCACLLWTPRASLRRFRAGGRSLDVAFSSMILRIRIGIGEQGTHVQGSAHRSRKSGFASPMRSFAPFQVEPLSTFMPDESNDVIRTERRGGAAG